MGTGPGAGPSGPTNPPTQAALPQPAETFREPALDAPPTSHSPRRRLGAGQYLMDREWPAVEQARPGAWGGALGPSRGWNQVEHGGSGYRSGEGGKPLISSLTPCDFLPLFNP